MREAHLYPVNCQLLNVTCVARRAIGDGVPIEEWANELMYTAWLSPCRVEP